MKTLLIGCFLLLSVSSFAQWSTAGGLALPPVTTGGRVGIGIASPENNLHIDGGTAGSSIKIGNTLTTNRISSWYSVDATGLTTLQSWKAGVGGGGWALAINPSGGNVGIGTTSPENNLHIDGGTIGSSIKLGNTLTTNRISSWYSVDATGLTTLQSWKAGAGGGGWTLAINPSGGKVGIGTSAPENNLHIDGGSAGTSLKLGSTSPNRTAFWIGTDATGGNTTLQSWLSALGGGSALLLNPSGGKVGIGTPSPGANLHVKSDNIRLEGVSTVGGNIWDIKCRDIVDNDFGIYNVSQSAYRLYVNNLGNVGIGTTTPGSFKLAVNGKIWGQEVQVALNNPGPDYVFEKDYALPSLESVKSYIDQNKHLPEVPSAKEMEANGINLSEMNMLLLKKVEELTLYMLDQNKKMKDQNEVIHKQTERITSLEKLITK